MNRTVLLAVVAVALIAAGCGDDGGEEAVPSPAPTTAPAIEAPEPTEPPEDEEAAEPEGQTYRVRRGDTLSSIAREFDTTVRALVRLNDIDDPNKIKAGRRLKIPPG